MEEDNDSKKDEAEKRMQELKAEMASLKKQLPKSPASQHEEAERHSSDAKSDGHTIKKISDKAYLLRTTVDDLKHKVAACSGKTTQKSGKSLASYVALVVSGFGIRTDRLDTGFWRLRTRFERMWESKWH